MKKRRNKKSSNCFQIIVAFDKRKEITYSTTFEQHHRKYSSIHAEFHSTMQKTGENSIHVHDFFYHSTIL